VNQEEDRKRYEEERKRGTQKFFMERELLRRGISQPVKFSPLSHVGKVALVCIAKDEDRYIDEWIDYHLKLGVDEIFIYENDWRSGIERDRVHTIPFDGPTRQTYSYNHFIFTMSKEFEWVIFIDVDEFVCLKKHKSIQEFLRDYGNIPQNVDGIAMSWVYFGDGNNVSPNGSVLERFTWRGAKPERSIKIIVKLNGDRMMFGPHNSFGFWVDTNGQVSQTQSNYEPPIDVIQLNHYIVKTLPEYEQKCARGSSCWYVGRAIEEFEELNKNEVEDLTALNFIRS